MAEAAARPAIFSGSESNQTHNASLPLVLVVSEMAAMNKNYDGANYYRSLWEKDVIRSKRLAHKKTIADGFNFVKNVDMLPQSIIGTV